MNFAVVNRVKNRSNLANQGSMAVSLKHKNLEPCVQILHSDLKKDVFAVLKLFALLTNVESGSADGLF